MVTVSNVQVMAHYYEEVKYTILVSCPAVSSYPYVEAIISSLVLLSNVDVPSSRILLYVVRWKKEYHGHPAIVVNH